MDWKAIAYTLLGISLVILFTIFRDAFRRTEITEDEIAEEVKKIKAEQTHRRKFIDPPPLRIWQDMKNGKLGEVHTNQDEIDRWHKEHYDWLPDHAN